MKLKGAACIGGALTVLALAAMSGCSWIRSGGDAGADAVARGAKIAALSTARAGALVGKGSYSGGRRAVTWTSARTVDGTQATLDILGLTERPVPEDVLDRLPDQMLEFLASLEFVAAHGSAEQVVISSPDSRWEGELFYQVDPDQWVEVRIDGPAELIVISMICFPAGRFSPAERAAYTVTVRENREFLGEVDFETVPNHLNCIYGQEDLRVSHPGVFVVRALEGEHDYRFNLRRDRDFGPGLIAFFLPRYADD